MKRTVAVILTLLMVAAMLVSCGNSRGGTTSGSTSESVASPVSSGKEQNSSTQASETPTPTPTPETPTPSPSDGNTIAAGKTEEDLGVLPVGQYTITPKGSDKRLSYANKEKNSKVDIEESLGGELDQFTIVYQTHRENPYYLVFAGDDSMHTLATVNFTSPSAGAQIVFRGKQRYQDGYYDDKMENMQWRIVKNDDGSYTFYSNASGKNLVLSLKDGSLTLEAPDTAEGITSFELNMVTRGGGNTFIQYISDGGDVVIRLPKDIRNRAEIKDEQLQLWANHLEDAYHHYIDLTSYVAYESIVVKAYEPSHAVGYVWNSLEHYNVITIDETFIFKDLQKMAFRHMKYGVEDWNFCALHEMGHMFDNQQPWYFEAEMMTDVKVAYVLQAGGGCAAPSEHPFSEFFYADGQEGHKQIEECYLVRSGGKRLGETEYNAYGAALQFVEVQRKVDDSNWTVFKQVYAELHEQGVTTRKNYEKFTNFIDKIAEISGKDVRALFPDEMWDVFMKKYGYTG